jgi:hypothetical protein
MAGCDRAIGHPGRRAPRAGRSQEEWQMSNETYYPLWSIAAMVIDIFVIWAVAAYGRDFRSTTR